MARRSILDGDEALTPQELEALRRAQGQPRASSLLDLLPVPASIRPAPAPVQAPARATLPGGVVLRGPAVPAPRTRPTLRPTPSRTIPVQPRPTRPTLQADPRRVGVGGEFREGLDVGADMGLTGMAVNDLPGTLRAVDAGLGQQMRQGAATQRERDREALRAPGPGRAIPQPVEPEAQDPSWAEAMREVFGELSAGRTEGMAEGAARALGEGVGQVVLDPIGDALFLAGGKALAPAVRRMAQRPTLADAAPRQALDGLPAANQELAPMGGLRAAPEPPPAPVAQRPTLRVPGAQAVGRAARDMAETAREVGQGFAAQAVDVGGRTARPGVIGPVSPRRRPAGTLDDPLTPRATEGPDLPLAGRAFNAANFGGGLEPATLDRLRDAAANTAESLAEDGLGAGSRVARRDTMDAAAELGLEGVLDLERNVQNRAGLSAVELTAAHRVMRDLGEAVGQAEARAFGEASPAAREAAQEEARRLSDQFRRVARVAGYGRTEAGRALNMLALGPRNPFDAARVVQRARSVSPNIGTATEQRLVDVAGEGQRLVDAAEAANQAARQADELTAGIPAAVKAIDEGPMPTPQDIARSMSDLAQARRLASDARLRVQAIQRREQLAKQASKRADKDALRAEAAALRVEEANAEAAAAVADANARRAAAIARAQEAKAAGRQADQAERQADKAEGQLPAAKAAADEAYERFAAAEARKEAAQAQVDAAKAAQKAARDAERAAAKAEGRAVKANEATKEADAKLKAAQARLAAAEEAQAKAKAILDEVKAAEKEAKKAEKKLERMEAKADGSAAAIAAAKKATQAAKEKQAELLEELRKLNATPFGKAVTSFMQANLLSGTATPLRGVVGNLSNVAVESLAGIPASAVDAVVSLISKERSMLSAPEKMGTWAKSTSRSFTEGWQQAKETMIYGATLDELAKMDQAAGIYLGESPGARILTGYINGVFSLQSAADKPFRLYALHRRLDELAVLEAKKQAKAGGLSKLERSELEANLRENPTAEMMLDAVAVSEEAVFANKTWLATAIQRGPSMASKEVQALAAKTGGPGGAMAARIGSEFAEVLTRYYIPFINMPMSGFDRVLDFTPIGAARGVAELALGLAYGMTRQQQRQISQRLGRSTIGSTPGWGIIALGGELYRNGYMTPAYDPQQAETYKANERGWGAIRIPGLSSNWLPLAFMAPIGPLLILGATMEAMGDKGLGDKAMALGGGVASVMAEMPALAGLKSFTETAKPGGGGVAQFGKKTALDLPYRLTPGAAMLRDIAVVTDPSAQRPYTAGDTLGEEAINRLKAGIPGLRSSLPREQLGLGDVAQAPSGIGAGQFSPFRSVPALEGSARRADVNAVLQSGLNLPPRDKELTANQIAKALDNDALKEPGVKVALTAAEQNDWNGSAGRARSVALEAHLRQGGSGLDAASLRKVIGDADELALEMFMMRNPQITSRTLQAISAAAGKPKASRPVAMD